MQKLMLKKIRIIFFLFTSLTFGQNLEQDVNKILNDLVLYCGKYTNPVTETVIYQSSTAWMFSPKLKKDWSYTLGVNTNYLFVTKSDQRFNIKNSDFEIFKIVGVDDNSLVSVPTALGGTSATYIQANINLFGSPVNLSTRFDGYEENYIAYPYLQGSIALPKGFELMAKYSFRVKYEKREHLIYGLALQYNLNRLFPKLIEKNINIATLIAYNNQKIAGDLKFASSTTLDLGLDRLISNIESYQLQFNASKTFKKFEVIAGLILNKSVIKYNFEFTENPQYDARDLLNTKVKDLDKTQNIVFGELSGRYNVYSDFYLQSTFSIGNNFNTNFGVQYEFN